jgi:peptide/nickel transport system permease protein
MARRSFRWIIIKRLINVAITIFGIMSLNFALIHLMPGDPIANVIPKDPKFPQSLRWELVNKFHLNDSLPEQYVYYIKNTITLDWGTSYKMNGQKVINIIAGDIRWTLLLVGVSTVITTLMGIAIGAYSAYRRRGVFDVSATSLSLFLYGMPTFWFAMLLQILFNTHPLGMQWWPQLPTSGYWDTNKYGINFQFSLPLILSVMKYLILPVITLAIGSLAGISLIMRSSLIDVMTEDFIMTARAKGLTDYQVLRRHALPVGMPPMIALIAMDVAFIIGGAYQVEFVFNYPGIGYRTIWAIDQLDFPILQFIVVIGGVAVVLANFLSDLILMYTDPRIRIA